MRFASRWAILVRQVRWKSQSANRFFMASPAGARSCFSALVALPIQCFSLWHPEKKVGENRNHRSNGETMDFVICVMFQHVPTWILHQWSWSHWDTSWILSREKSNRFWKDQSEIDWSNASSNQFRLSRLSLVTRSIVMGLWSHRKKYEPVLV